MILRGSSSSDFSVFAMTTRPGSAKVPAVFARVFVAVAEIRVLKKEVLHVQ